MRHRILRLLDICMILNVRPPGEELFNTLRPRQDGRHFPDDIFKCIFVNEKFWILIKISLKFVPKGLIDNDPALVQIMAWRRPGDKPLSEPMMVSLPTHICGTRPPQWVNLDEDLDKWLHPLFMRVAVTHPSLTSLSLGYGWVITYHYCTWT